MVLCMIARNPAFRRRITAVILLAAITILVLSSGCTQTGAQQGAQSAEQKKFLEVTAAQPDTTHIIVTYQGGPNMEKIMELETMVTDSHGASRTQSIGSRLATTPITIQGTNTMTGAYEGQDHVVVTGYFADGSRKVLLDTTI
jgi:hypothetical protein